MSKAGLCAVCGETIVLAFNTWQHIGGDRLHAAVLATNEEIGRMVVITGNASPQATANKLRENFPASWVAELRRALG